MVAEVVAREGSLFKFQLAFRTICLDRWTPRSCFNVRGGKREKAVSARDEDMGEELAEGVEAEVERTVETEIEMNRADASTDWRSLGNEEGVQVEWRRRFRFESWRPTIAESIERRELSGWQTGRSWRRARKDVDMHRSTEGGKRASATESVVRERSEADGRDGVWWMMGDADGRRGSRWT
jgi:hypothetical protein